MQQQILILPDHTVSLPVFVEVPVVQGFARLFVVALFKGCSFVVFLSESLGIFSVVFV